MQITDFFNGILAPFYALFGGGFHPNVNFGQLILCVLVVLVMISSLINMFRK